MVGMSLRLLAAGVSGAEPYPGGGSGHLHLGAGMKHKRHQFVFVSKHLGVGPMRVLRIIAAFTIVSAALLVAMPADAHTKRGTARDSFCTMEIKGWNGSLNPRPGASVTDVDGSCGDIRPRVYWNNGSNWKTDSWTWNDYQGILGTEIGPHWSRARGWHDSASPRSWSVWH